MRINYRRLLVLSLIIWVCGAAFLPGESLTQFPGTNLYFELPEGFSWNTKYNAFTGPLQTSLTIGISTYPYDQIVQQITTTMKSNTQAELVESQISPNNSFFHIRNNSFEQLMYIIATKGYVYTLTYMGVPLLDKHFMNRYARIRDTITINPEKVGDIQELQFFALPNQGFFFTQLVSIRHYFQKNYPDGNSAIVSIGKIPEIKQETIIKRYGSYMNYYTQIALNNEKAKGQSITNKEQTICKNESTGSEGYEILLQYKNSENVVTFLYNCFFVVGDNVIIIEGQPMPSASRKLSALLRWGKRPILF